MPRPVSKTMLPSSTMTVIKRSCYENIKEFYRRFGPSKCSGYECTMYGSERKRKYVGSGDLDMSITTFYKAMAGVEVSQEKIDDIERLAVKLGLKDRDGAVSQQELARETFSYILMLLDELENNFNPDTLADLYWMKTEHHELLSQWSYKVSQEDLSRVIPRRNRQRIARAKRKKKF